MRVVLDTNVLVSAAFWDGPEWRVLQKCIGGEHQMILSPPILEELHRVLENKFRLPAAEASMYFLILLRHSEIVEPIIEVTAVKDDPSDNRILEAALSGRADMIVSGDRHLLALQKHHGIPIRRATAMQ